MVLKKTVIDELKTSIEIFKEQIEGSKVVLQNKNIPATSENVLKAAQIIATNRLAETNSTEPKETSNKITK